MNKAIEEQLARGYKNINLRGTTRTLGASFT